MTDEPQPHAMTDEERALYELGEDGVIEDAPDSDDPGDETSDDGIEDDPADEETS
jgi:hypothetical protein